MNKLLIAGMRLSGDRAGHRADAAQMLVDGRVRVGPMVTHRLPWQQTAEAYHMLFNKPEEALAVILEWD